MEDFVGMRALVLGLGRSGRSAARYLAERGARVTAVDERDASGLEELESLVGVETRTGAPFPPLDDFDVVVPSPGVPLRRWAARRAVALGDVELAWRALTVPVVAVTGTNGKTTTTLLIEAMLRAAGWRAEAAGNVGRPALELVGRPLDVAVLEVSSFQLEATQRFRPRVATLLNVAPDHLDWHEDFDAYRVAKARIFANQGPEDHAIWNDDDGEARRLGTSGRGRRWRFRRHGPVEAGAWWDAGAVVLRDGSQTLRVPLPEPAAAPIPEEDVLAALLACLALGADVHKAAAALLGFRVPPHRREPVAHRNGVTWIDDSKATNPAAAIHALESAAQPVIWIAGGRHKGTDLGPLADVAARCARAALLIGEASGALEAALAGRVPVVRAGDLETAVAEAQRRARAGDVVLLSPACASFDQFRDYEERGQRFRAAVEALSGTEAT